MKLFLKALIPLLTTFLAGCSSVDAGQPERLPIVQACFITDETRHTVALEVASEDSDRQKGLMGRKSLGESEGMVFEYQEQRRPSYGFWMFKTLIPLDIAFLDNQGVIVSIRQMHPCASPRGSDCPSYPAGEPFWNAVEMNAGYFSARGIRTGDRLVWPANGRCQL